MIVGQKFQEEDFTKGGVSISVLAEMFNLTIRDATRRIGNKLSPLPIANGAKLYRVREAAPLLCDVKVDPEEYLKSLSPTKMPPVLQDAFWKAQNSKQRWEETRGDLWRTQRVFEAISNAFKVIRLTILMFVDTVAQRSELTQEQRTIIQDLGDGLLASLEKSLHEEFDLYNPPPDEHGMPLSDDVVLLDEVEADEWADAA
ncbi:MAG: hypothetical protein M3R16_03080 [Pseudomonadota bacterium]|nr:hypothetical protein [Pseudomonadota bacterium]